MVTRNTIRRRAYLASIATSSLAGCLDQILTKRNRPGVIDASDLTMRSSASATLEASNINKNNNDRGLKLTTNDTIVDGQVSATIPVKIPDAQMSTIYIKADVDELDDDADVEIRFQSSNTKYRMIFIGNEYKSKKNGVLATENGTGFELEEKFKDLPAPDNLNNSKINELNEIRIIIRDGDFAGKFWTIWFIFPDRSIGIL